MGRHGESFHNGYCSVLNFVCYAKFVRYYYPAAKPEDKDWQLVGFTDNLLDNINFQIKGIFHEYH